ncbi:MULTISPECIES: hypothetical protein [unclassified Cupriavidus]|uniref:hypothetical protein n=1 Tax=unclassified Cupriavidus TaxID=2640874 RepID=UPI0010F7806D|nr:MULTISPECIES: hypothetical protein [unclassified Cupriavidus]MWL87772.1 hypothetical protein [Cupriavidus sp. SW-Y-13]
MSAIFALLACIFLGAPIEWYGVGAICAVWDLFRAADLRKQMRLLEAHIEELEAPVVVRKSEDFAPRLVS